MATTLIYTLSPFVPFTVIRSADVNQYFTDIKNRINWAGGASTTTGLGDDNLQSNSVSGGGLTRSTKLKLGTAYAFIVNSSTGALTEVISTANQTIYTNGFGVPTAGSLPLAAGGTGASITPGADGDVLQFQGGVIVAQAIPGQSANRLFTFRNFS